MASIDELIQKIQQLQDQLAEQTEKVDAMMAEAREAVDYASHAYRVDHYGFIWAWDTKTQDFKKTNMRICTPKIADRALQSRHIADAAVEGRHMQDNIIEGRMIKDKTIGGDKIKNREIGSNHIKERAIGSEHIKNHAVEGYHILPGAVTYDKLDKNTLDLHDVVLNSNFITMGRDPDGTLYAIYGNQAKDLTIERDIQGWLYFVRHSTPQPSI